MLKSLSIAFIALLMLSACHESIEERAQREAKEFTKKKCPTPKDNNTITDSIVFYPDTRTYTTYTRFCDKLDDSTIVEANKEKALSGLKQGILSNSNLQPYVEAGFNFRFVAVSDKDRKKVLLEKTFKASELKK